MKIIFGWLDFIQFDWFNDLVLYLLFRSIFVISTPDFFGLSKTEEQEKKAAKFVSDPRALPNKKFFGTRLIIDEIIYAPGYIKTIE